LHIDLFAVLMYGYFPGITEVVEAGLSSNSILTGGLTSSSYCPFFKLQMNSPRNIEATQILANINTMITLIPLSDFGSKVDLRLSDVYDLSQGLK